MSRPPEDSASVLTPEHGRLYFQCRRCGAVSRRLDAFHRHLVTQCYAADFERARRLEAFRRGPAEWTEEAPEVAS